MNKSKKAGSEIRIDFDDEGATFALKDFDESVKSIEESRPEEATPNTAYDIEKLPQLSQPTLSKSDVFFDEVMDEPEAATRPAHCDAFYDKFLVDDNRGVILSTSSTPSFTAESDAQNDHDNIASVQPLNLAEALTLQGKIEAVLFASPKPVKAIEILDIVQTDDEPHTVKDIERVLLHLVKAFRQRAGGFKLEVIKGGSYQFQTVAAAAPLMEKLFASRPRPLSRAALETLSIIAYRQPVTRADIEFIRGVDAGSIIKNLMDRELIACIGRKEDAGRPMLFGTTEEFLKIFRLSNLTDLPPLSAFQPSPDTMNGALSQIEARSEVDVEEFISDALQDSTSQPVMAHEIPSEISAGSQETKAPHYREVPREEKASYDDDALLNPKEEKTQTCLINTPELDGFTDMELDENDEIWEKKDEIVKENFYGHKEKKLIEGAIRAEHDTDFPDIYDTSDQDHENSRIAASDDFLLMNLEGYDGTDPTTEMDVPVGTCLPKTGRDLD